MTRRHTSGLVAACIGLSFAACGGGGGDHSSADALHGTASTEPERRTREIGDRGSFYLRAADQDSDGRTVVVEEAVLTGTQGWVVVHTHEGRSLGRIIGASALLPEGTSKNVPVTFTDPPTGERATVYPMIHVESTGNTTMDYPRGDKEASSSDGNVVVLPMFIRIG